MEKLYDVLLQDQQILDILKNFHSTFWKDLSFEQKKDLFINFELRISEILNENQSNIIFGEKEIVSAEYIPSTNEIFINEAVLKREDYSQYTYLYTFMHERFHKFQFDTIKNPSLIQKDVKLDEKFIEEWKLNSFFNGKLQLRNYFLSKDVEVSKKKYLQYLSQPLERDAINYGNDFAIKAGKKLQSIYGKDEKFNNYLFELIVSASFAYENKDILEESIKESKQIWDKNMKTYQKASETIKMQKLYLANIESLDENKFNFFFNEYIWMHLNFEEKYIVLKELQNKENYSKNTDIDIFKVDDKGLYIGNEFFDKNLVEKSYSIQMLNSFYFVFYTEYLIDKLKKDIDGYENRHLKVNLYVDEDEDLPNYYYEDENPLLFLIQPATEEKFRYLHKKISYLKPYAIKKFYETDEDHPVEWTWLNMLEIYDYDKTIELCENLFDKDFKTLREELIEKMERNIMIKEIERSR